MVELPHEMRELLVERLDDFISDLTDSTDFESIAHSIIKAIQSTADEAEYEKADEVVARLESSGELEGSLAEVLEEHFEAEEEFDYTGEDLVNLLEKLCEIEWADLDDEGEDDLDDFFDDDDQEDDF